MITSDHILSFLTGSVGFGILAHAVNTLPVPSNAWGRWFVGILQFAVGQRERSSNTFSGADTITKAVPKENK